MNRKTKLESKTILINIGYWKAFTNRREVRKADGLSGQEAQQEVFDEFFPDGVEGEPVLPDYAEGGVVEPGSVGTDMQPAHNQEEVQRVAGFSRDSQKTAKLPEGALEGKVATKTEIVNWVVTSMAYKKEPDWKTCPSAEAWTILVWVRASPLNFADFMKTMWSRLLPSKAEVDATARMSDDGRSVMNVISMIQKSLRPDNTDKDGV